jgi:uncharacterized protein YciI
MTHYIVEYRQIGDAALRELNRPDHVAYRKGLGSQLVLAGPLLDDDAKPEGSIVIVEADDRAQATQIANADPFVAAELFDLVSVRAFRIAALNPSPPDGR